MTATHDLDHAAAGNATQWAGDVDATVNRLSALDLGRLTNVAGVDQISGRLAMSEGFAGVSTGARFSFVAAGDNTGAVTMQLKTSAGANAGSAFGLRDGDGVSFPAGSLLAGRLYTFEYDATEGFARQVFVQPSAAVVAATPVGMVAPFAGVTAPAGWLFCHGQNVSRTTYAALFTALSTTYGPGDGSTTFALPDLRGRVVAGKDDMGGTSANRLTNQSGGLDGDVLGAAGGAETHALTDAQMKLVYNSSASGDVTGVRAANANGSGAPHNNVQPTFILNYIIYAGA